MAVPGCHEKLQIIWTSRESLQDSHSQYEATHPSLHAREVVVGLYASRNIEVGEELTYDYGDQPDKPYFMRRIKVRITHN